MARHAPGHGMDCVLDVDASRLEEIGELADDALGLCDCKPLAGDDHDALGVGEHDRRVLRAHLAIGLAVRRGCGRGSYS